MMIHWWHDRHIDHYFAGRIGMRAETRVRRRLGRCAACRAYYQRHLVAEAAMPEGEARALDRLWHGILAASGRPRPPGRGAWAATGASAPAPFSSSRTRLAWAGALAGALMVAIVGIFGRQALMPRKIPAEPVARGALPATAPLPAIHIFRSVSEHAAEPVGAGPIHAHDGLLFAYTNPDPGLSHLMVFSVDQDYAVHWYYPAYQHPGEDPIALAILPGATGMELGEEIRHDLRPGPVRVYALFLRGPRRVLEIEAMVRRLIEEPHLPVSRETPLPVPGSVQSSVLLEVEP